MCTGPEAMIVASVIGAGTTIATTAMAPKPKAPASMPTAVPKSTVPQASKEADKQTANAIKSAKQRTGVATPNTLLTGSQGVADEELNLGGSRLI